MLIWRSHFSLTTLHGSASAHISSIWFFSLFFFFCAHKLLLFHLNNFDFPIRDAFAHTHNTMPLDGCNFSFFFPLTRDSISFSLTDRWFFHVWKLGPIFFTFSACCDLMKRKRKKKKIRDIFSPENCTNLWLLAYQVDANDLLPLKRAHSW